MHKKAEMGVGTLIIFIAMLLVAAVAAGVLIQTAGSLQEKSLATGQQARAQISTNARVIEVSGSDGRLGNLTDFQEIKGIDLLVDEIFVIEEIIEVGSFIGPEHLDPVLEFFTAGNLLHGIPQVSLLTFGQA